MTSNSDDQDRDQYLKAAGLIRTAKGIFQSAGGDPVWKKQLLDETEAVAKKAELFRELGCIPLK